MRDFKILFLYPNLRKESTVPPSITLLSRILKNHSFKTDVFDSTGYEVKDRWQKDKKEEILTARVSAHVNVDKGDFDDMAIDLNKKINDFNPDLIAISSTESTFLFGVDMVKSIKDRKAPVIWAECLRLLRQRGCWGLKRLTWFALARARKLCWNYARK